VLEALSATLGWLGFVAFGRQRDLFIQTCRSALRVREGNKFLDVNFDGLLKRGYSYLKLTEVNSPNFEQQASSALFPSNLDPVLFTFWGRVLGRLFPVKAFDFCALVSSLLQRELDMAVDPDWLLTRISTVHWQAKLYGLLLGRLKPKAILVSDTGAYALRLAAFRKRIPFIELQHGVFNNEHPDAVPLWASGSRGELFLPDVLAVRGEYWLDQLGQTLQGRDCAVAVGDAMTSSARARRVARVRDGDVRLVVTSQGLDTERLVAWIDELARCAPSSLRWHLSVKLHPYYESNPAKYAPLKAHDRIKIVSGSELPNVFDLLADSDLHLTIASACHFDAGAIGVRSAIIPLDGHELLMDTVDGSLFYKVTTQQEVWDIVTSPPSFDPSEADRYSAPGYVDNLVALLPVLSSVPGQVELQEAPE
jgi:hypothetical protein